MWLVTGKLLADALPSFTFFITQVFALMLIVAMAPLTKSRQLPSLKLLVRFVAMGTFDNAGMVLSMLSNPHVDGGMQVLLTQAIIPLAMLNSVLFLKRRYRPTHYAGALVIIAGIAVSIGDSLLSGAASDSWGWVAVCVLANVPPSLSCVLKDATFKPEHGAKIAPPGDDVFWVNLWVSVFQFLSGLPLFPLVSPLMGLPMPQLPENFRLALQCIFALQEPNTTGGDRCGVSATVLMVLYTVSGIAYGVFLLSLITRESASLAVTGAALTVPVANLAFSIPWLNQLDGTLSGFSWWNLASLVLVVCGLALYLHSPESSKQTIATDEAQAPLCPLVSDTGEEECSRSSSR